MIDWLLKCQRYIVGFSRWIVLGCALALFGISRLPKTPVDQIIGALVVIAAGTIFVVWLVITAVTILAPRVFDDLRHRRADTTFARKPTLKQ